MARTSFATRSRPAAATSSPGAVRAPARRDEQAEIARVAYELWEKRGRTHGNHQTDWLEAERIVRARRS